MSSSASAICGTRLGFTKLAASSRRTPAPISRSINSALVAVDTVAGSLCRPSRAATSTICTPALVAPASAPLGPPVSFCIGSPYPRPA